jgi:hypothetical protein
MHGVNRREFKPCGRRSSRSQFPGFLRYSFAATVVFAVVGAFDSSARAGTVLNLSFVGQDATARTSSNLSVSLYNNVNGTGLVTTVGVNQGGGFDWKVNGSSGGLTFVGYSPLGATSAVNILTFCIELTQHVANDSQASVVPLEQAPQPSSGPITDTGNNPVIGMGPVAAGRIMQLWSDNFDKVLHPSNYTYPNSTTNLTQSDAVGAFQLAIWKIEYDASNNYGAPLTANFGAGYLRADTNSLVTKLATAWINAINNNDPSANLMALTGGKYTNFQDQVFAIPDVGPHASPIPEPGSFAIWSLVAIVGAAAKGCRRRHVETAVVP